MNRFLCVALSMLLASCSAGPSGGGGGGAGDGDGPAPGEAGGACRGDGTCGAGLACNAANVCEAAGGGEGEGEGEGEVETLVSETVLTEPSEVDHRLVFEAQAGRLVSINVTADNDAANPNTNVWVGDITMDDLWEDPRPERAVAETGDDSPESSCSP